jgi:hypothetical protein
VREGKRFEANLSEEDVTLKRSRGCVSVGLDRKHQCSPPERVAVLLQEQGK